MKRTENAQADVLSRKLGYCYGVGGTRGKSRVARHVRAASPVYLSFLLS
jgi:hypothetical protein